MRESLTAWAGDCQVRGEVDFDDGRLSDQVNEGELLTFFQATLEDLEDGHEVTVDELEVERRELHLIEIDGHQGDPIRRTRADASRPDPLEGMRVLSYSDDGLEEVGKFVEDGGSNYWGVEVHRLPGGRKLILGSDRDRGLRIFEYDPDYHG